MDKFIYLLDDIKKNNNIINNHIDKNNNNKEKEILDIFNIKIKKDNVKNDNENKKEENNNGNKHNNIEEKNNNKYINSEKNKLIYTRYLKNTGQKYYFYVDKEDKEWQFREINGSSLDCLYI